ncbi:MAG: TraX protein [Ruminococcaceae bacterium]|nr:TraX protein [Oscillospiraceae bacterium]
MGQRNIKILSGSMLKLLAVILMFIDHFASTMVYVLPVLATPFTVLGKELTIYWIMRKIGRMAFPIFCFLIAEGYCHTKNKAKYALRLLLFALISEIPFDLMFFTRFDLNAQNVFFTLFSGLMLICLFESKEKQLLKFVMMGGVCFLTHYLATDYGMPGALLVLAIYILRHHPAAQALICYPLLSGGLAAEAAFIPINMYNGQRGFIKGPVLKFLFYAFYPLHILILVGIRYLMQS